MSNQKNNNPHNSKTKDMDLLYKCRVCGSGDTWIFTKIHGLPVHSNILPLSHSAALRVPIGDLEMSCCKDCGHIYNTAFSYQETKYSSEYENSLFFSETFRNYASSLATELINQFDLHNKKIVEIGCGSGDFLNLLCEKGGNNGIGFDPSASAERSFDRYQRITHVRDYYSAKYAHLDADILCCRQVLEHIELPLKFLKEIREALPTGKKIGLFFEVPNVMFMLKALSSWDFIYEHCSYFSISSLNRLFSMCGFEVRKIWRTFNDQFLCAWVEPASGGSMINGILSDMDKKEVLTNAEIFGSVFQKQLQGWEQRLLFLNKSKEKVVLWGAGSKAVTFLNILRGVGTPEYVVDVNKIKHGKYIPGTAQKIVSPDFLKEYRPDTVILMNPAYEAEVCRTISEMNLTPKIIIANHPVNG